MRKTRPMRYLKNKGGRPRRTSDPLRLQKDAIAIVLHTLHEVRCFPAKRNIARLTNMLVDPATKTILELRGDLVVAGLICADNVSEEKLKNQSHYTAQVMSRTTSSDSAYAPDEARFVQSSSEIIFNIMIADHFLVAKHLSALLVKPLGWPKAIAERIGDLAILQNGGDPSYFDLATASSRLSETRNRLTKQSATR